MKLSILLLLTFVIACVSAQGGLLFGSVEDLSSSSSSSCSAALFDIFGPGCDASGACSVPTHGIGVTITTSNSRTKETTFLRGCLQIDTMGATGLVLTNIARPGFFGVLSSDALSCCGGRGQPFDVSRTSFSINYIEIDQVGRTFIRTVDGLTVNFTLSCPNCDSFPAIGYLGELIIIMQFSLFPSGVCPDVPIGQPCTGGPDSTPCVCPSPSPSPLPSPSPSPVPSPSPSPEASPSPLPSPSPSPEASPSPLPSPSPSPEASPSPLPSPSPSPTGDGDDDGDDTGARRWH